MSEKFQPSLDFSEDQTSSEKSPAEEKPVDQEGKAVTSPREPIDWDRILQDINDSKDRERRGKDAAAGPL